MSTRCSRRWPSFLLATLVVGAPLPMVCIPSALGQPQPAPVPKRWQLDLEMGPFRMATVDVGGVPRAYYYLTYRVVNNTGRDQLLAPAWDLASEDSAVQRSGRDVPAEVTREIINRLGNPFIQDQIAIIGPLLQGVENAKYGVVIWPVREMNVDYIQVFAAGFSGETATIKTPDPETGATKSILLRKTLMTRYHSPGELDPNSIDPLPPEDRRWVMR